MEPGVRAMSSPIGSAIRRTDLTPKHALRSAPLPTSFVRPTAFHGASASQPVAPSVTAPSLNQSMRLRGPRAASWGRKNRELRPHSVHLI